MFQKARFRLTAWYLVIIMAISLLFSFVIYQIVNQEFVRMEHFDRRRMEEDKNRHIEFREFQLQQAILPSPVQIRIRRIDPEFIPEARTRLLVSLGFINVAILVLAGGAGYFLAGRTLRPIKEMMDEQNRFITDASHELRTPLTSLRSEIEVGLRNKNLKLDESKKLLESNLEEVVTLQTLSDNLLELAQNGETNPRHTTNVSIAISIESALKKLSGIIKKKHITIQKSFTNHTIHGVQDRINELFVILLDNAVKYSPEKSTITITSKPRHKMLEIIVKDEGIGIDEKDLPHIFGRFYRANKSRSKKEVSGYGLGLSIAKKIVASHNGTIEIKSVLQKGTTVIIEFPMDLA